MSPAGLTAESPDVRPALLSQELLADGQIVSLRPMLSNLAVNESEDMDELPFDMLPLRDNTCEQREAGPLVSSPQRRTDSNFVTFGNHVIDGRHFIGK